jgi:hypothetical protein
VTAGTLAEHLGLTGIKKIDVRQKKIPSEQFLFGPFAWRTRKSCLVMEVSVKVAANDEDRQSDDKVEGDPNNDLPVIREQTFESLQILRNLLSLLMPKEDDGGPKLVDLLAALIAQQRDIQSGITRLQSDLNALFHLLEPKPEGEIQRGRDG